MRFVVPRPGTTFSHLVKIKDKNIIYNIYFIPL
jgi:hypothetical protein